MHELTLSPDSKDLGYLVSGYIIKINQMFSMWNVFFGYCRQWL